jgi:hydroxymethylpyrimidine/phosphomethylpyrimidine kinase
MAHVVLTVMKHDASYRSAMNIKYAEKTVDICKKVGFTVKSFDRKDEPIEKKDKEGFSLEWGVNKVLEQSKIIPDIIYDKGGWGKEPMIRVLGKNPLDVVNKIERLFKHL